jgi:hypothetical protein
MDTMNIKTNHHPNLLLEWDQLTPEEQAERCDDEPGSLYMRYRGVVYSTDDFMTINWYPWHGVVAHTVFSGVLMRFHDQDHVVMGRYYE